MVSVQGELCIMVVGLEMYNSPYNSKALTFVGGVVAFGLVIAFRRVSNNVLQALLVMLT